MSARVYGCAFFCVCVREPELSRRRTTEQRNSGIVCREAPSHQKHLSGDEEMRASGGEGVGVRDGRAGRQSQMDGGMEKEEETQKLNRMADKRKESEKRAPDSV